MPDRPHLCGTGPKKADVTRVSPGARRAGSGRTSGQRNGARQSEINAQGAAANQAEREAVVAEAQ